MQFKVPQFLEIEDKIFGPFTFKEFAYLAGGGGICFVLYKLLGLFWAFIPMLIVAGLSALLTFYKPNNKPFINMLEAGFEFFLQDKLYIWKRREQEVSPGGALKLVTSTSSKEEVMNNHIAKLTGSKLRDLAWSLDVLDLKKQQDRAM